jgi:hypothetical protein
MLCFDELGRLLGLAALLGVFGDFAKEGRRGGTGSGMPLPVDAGLGKVR